MKKTIYFYCFILFCSCMSPKDRNDSILSFEKVLHPKTRKHLDDYMFLIRPTDLYICCNHLYLKSYQTDTVFYVLSLPDLELVHSFGRRGSGPGEFINPILYRNLQSEELYIAEFDFRGSSVNGYRFSKPKEMQQTDYFYLTCESVTNDVFLLNDSLLVCSPNNLMYIPIINYKKNIIADSIFFKEKDPDHDGSLHINWGSLGSNGDFLVYVYSNKPQIDIYDSSFKLIKSIIKDYTHSPYRYIENKITYYSSIVAGKKYFYCIYSGKNFSENVDKEYTLEVYNYDGEIVGKYYLKEHIAIEFVVDEESKLLYGVSLFEDALYVYELPDI